MVVRADTDLVLPDGTTNENRNAAEARLNVGGDGAGAGGRAVDAAGRPPSRMGIGPGGPALGFDEAYRMLNAPANIGQVQQSVGLARGRGQEMGEEFREAAGGPISFGQQERGTLNAALEPDAKEDQYQAAREVLQRSYSGPMAMGQKQEGEKGLSPWEKTRRMAGESQIAGEAMGTGAGRSALYQMQGLTPGQARAQTKSQFDQPGYGIRARQTGAEAGSVYAGLGKEMKESAELGRERTEEARVAGGEAREEFHGRGESIVERARGRAADKNERIQASQEAYSKFVESGDLGDLGEHIQQEVFAGHMPVREAKAAWDATWGKSEYAHIAKYAPLQLSVHYTGKMMLSPSEETKQMWEDMFPGLSRVFDQMRDEKSGRLPGRWMDMLTSMAQAGGQKEWGALGDEGQEAFRLANPMKERRAGQGGSYIAKREATAQEAEAIYNREVYNKRAIEGDEARELLGIVQSMGFRQRELERDFGSDLPGLQGGGIRDFANIPTEGMAQVQGSGGRSYKYPGFGPFSALGGRSVPTARQGGYTGRNFLRPGEAWEGGRGQYADIMPLYLGGGRTALDPMKKMRDPNEGILVAPEGVATWQSELPQHKADEYNTIQDLLGRAEASVEAGEPIDPDIQLNLDKLISATETFRTEGAEALSENERDWRGSMRDSRDRYAKALRKANSGFLGGIFNRSKKFKTPPTFAGGGVRDVLEETDWT